MGPGVTSAQGGVSLSASDLNLLLTKAGNVEVRVAWALLQLRGCLPTVEYIADKRRALFSVSGWLCQAEARMLSSLCVDVVPIHTNLINC